MPANIIKQAKTPIIKPITKSCTCGSLELLHRPVIIVKIFLVVVFNLEL